MCKNPTNSHEIRAFSVSRCPKILEIPTKLIDFHFRGAQKSYKFPRNSCLFSFDAQKSEKFQREIPTKFIDFFHFCDAQNPTNSHEIRAFSVWRCTKSGKFPQNSCLMYKNLRNSHEIRAFSVWRCTKILESLTKFMDFHFRDTQKSLKIPTKFVPFRFRNAQKSYKFRRDSPMFTFEMHKILDIQTLARSWKFLQKFSDLQFQDAKKTLEIPTKLNDFDFRNVQKQKSWKFLQKLMDFRLRVQKPCESPAKTNHVHFRVARKFTFSASIRETHCKT